MVKQRWLLRQVQLYLWFAVPQLLYTLNKQNNKMFSYKLKSMSHNAEKQPYNKK